MKDKEKASRRKHTRVEADLSVRFTDDKGGFMDECVANISRGGIFVETFTPRGMRETVDLMLRLPNSPEEIAVQAEVVHVVTGEKDRDPEYQGRTGMGLRFTFVEPKQRTQLKAFIDAITETRGAGSRRYSRIYDYKQVKVKPAHGKEFATRFAPNLSRGGLFIETDDTFSLFDSLEIILESPQGGDQIRLAGEVVHIRKATAKSEETNGIGVKFINLTPELEAQLQTFIHQILDHEI